MPAVQLSIIAPSRSPIVADAGFHDVETSTIRIVFETDTPEQFTQFVQDIAPMITELMNEQPPEVQERIRRKVTEAYTQFQDADGRVRTENQSIWVVGTK